MTLNRPTCRRRSTRKSRARVSLEDGYTVIIVDIPVPVPDKGEGVYTTIPLGILLTQTTVTTVCAVDTPVLADFTAMRVRDFSTKKKMRFVYQILYRAATMYQLELRLVDRRRQEIEKNLAGKQHAGQRPDRTPRAGVHAGLLCHQPARQQHRAGPADSLQAAGAIP